MRVVDKIDEKIVEIGERDMDEKLNHFEEKNKMLVLPSSHPIQDVSQASTV